MNVVGALAQCSHSKNFLTADGRRWTQMKDADRIEKFLLYLILNLRLSASICG